MVSHVVKYQVSVFLYQIDNLFDQIPKFHVILKFLGIKIFLNLSNIPFIVHYFKEFIKYFLIVDKEIFNRISLVDTSVKE